MAGVVKQIIGSFEDIGRDIIVETAKLPGEMLGMGKPKPQKSSPNTPNSQNTPMIPPRAWLEERAGKNKQREPTVQERLNREKQEQQEKNAKKNVVEQNMAPLARMSQKAKRGNLYGNPQASSERSKNARND